MPKSKSRKSTKSTRPKRNHYSRPGCAGSRPRQIGSGQGTLVKVHRTNTCEGLSPTEVVERQFRPGGTIWQFPAKPAVKTIYGDPLAKDQWDASGVAELIALGSDDALLSTFDAFTIDLMRQCSPSGLEQTAYMEMFAYGMDNYFATDDETKRHRFENHYLGAWVDTSYAAGAFIRDLDGQSALDESLRKAAYERLKQMVQIVEHPMPDGRTIVIYSGEIPDLEKYLVNQYMIHDSMPEIVRV